MVSPKLSGSSGLWSMSRPGLAWPCSTPFSALNSNLSVFLALACQAHTLQFNSAVSREASKTSFEGTS